MFSEQGEFIPQGATEPITGSNVKTIIQYILLKADELMVEPVGFPEFCKQYMDVCETPQRRAKRRTTAGQEV